jgi:hypothetical protein
MTRNSNVQTFSLLLPFPFLKHRPHQGCVSGLHTERLRQSQLFINSRALWSAELCLPAREKFGVRFTLPVPRPVWGSRRSVREDLA